MVEVKERNQISDEFKWNLKTIFESDEAWQQELSTLDGLAEEGAGFKGKLNNAQDILAFLSWKFAAERKINKLYTYASLRSSEDTRDGKAAGMTSKVFSKVIEISSSYAYAQPELFSLEEEKLNEIINDPLLADYKFYLENMMRSKAHVLSEKEETLLSNYREALSASRNAATMLMDADIIFDDVCDGNGNKLPLSNATYGSYQASDDWVLRENSFRSCYKSYKQYVHTFAATYGGAITADTTEARIRGFNSSREMHMFNDNIPVCVYDNLIETMHKHMDLMYRYVALRKKILKLDEIHYYDLYAPLAKNSKKYSYEEAKQMVLEAVKPLGEDYVNRVQQAYDEGWIDVYPNTGKTGGAFSGGGYDTNPYILMNFSGTLEAVSTLAHEMGHSQHSWLARQNQPYQYSRYTMFVAEVASTVNENLLIDQLLAKCEDSQQRLALLNQYLEGFKGTVYRQVMFAEFEMKAHAMKEAGQSIDADALSAMYKDIVQLYFGPEMVLDDEVKYEWAKVPHFYMLFYVYVYASGYTSAVAISESILNNEPGAVEKYLEFLSMGGSQYPIEELKHAGVDMTTPAPIEKALEKFERILDDAEKTYALLEK